MPKKEKKINSRSWQLIIPLDFPVEEIKEKVKLIAKNYYFIKHDRDLDDFGVPKKEHWHLLCTFSNSRDLNTVKNYFAEFKKPESEEPYLLENSFEKINSIVGSKKYLCHFDHPNKAQYDYKEVETNDDLFKDLFSAPMAKADEFDYFVNALLKTKDNIDLQDFLYKFKIRFTALNSNQMFNNILSLIRYYKEFRCDFPKDFDDCYYEPSKGETQKPDCKVNIGGFGPGNDNSELPF